MDNSTSAEKYQKSIKSGAHGIVAFSLDGTTANKCVNIINPDVNCELDFSTFREVCFLKQFYKLKNIPEIKEFKEYKDKFVITMNNCGMTLLDFINHFNYTTRMEHFRCIFTSLIKTLIQFHSNNILHGDLKSSNICINPDTSQTTIVDFGYASLKTADRYNISLYTYDHIAPEILLDDYMDERSEVWVLGIIMITYIFRNIVTMSLINKDADDIRSNLKKEYMKIRKGERDWITANTLNLEDKKLAYLLQDMISFDPSKRPSLEYIMYNYFDERSIPEIKYLQFRYVKNVNLFNEVHYITLIDRKNSINKIYNFLNECNVLHLLTFTIELLDLIINLEKNMSLNEYNLYTLACTHLALNYMIQNKHILYTSMIDYFNINNYVNIDLNQINKIELHIFKLLNYKLAFDLFDKYISFDNNNPINYKCILFVLLTYENTCSDIDFMLKKYDEYKDITNE
jgi:serine/threonine protein kinase